MLIALTTHNALEADQPMTNDEWKYLGVCYWHLADIPTVRNQCPLSGEERTFTRARANGLVKLRQRILAPTENVYRVRQTPGNDWRVLVCIGHR